jgi:hypothetical protein
MSRSDFPDWQAKAASEALDEQRRHPRDYPLTREERLELEYDPHDYVSPDPADLCTP